MDPATVLFAALSTTVVAGTSVLTYLGSELRLRRMLRRSPRWPLAAMPEDTFGRVTGTAHPFEGEQLTAPLTGRPCVYYIAVVEQLGRWRGKRPRWTRLAIERRSVLFVLEDDGHRAIVDPMHARVTIDFDHVYRTELLPRVLREPATQTAGAPVIVTDDHRQGGFLINHHLVNRDWSGMTELCYREAVIEVGENIAVLGSGVREPDLEARPDGDAYRTTGGTRLRLTGSRRYPLVISDYPTTLA